MIIRSIIFGFALAVLPTVAHAETVILSAPADAPRHVSIFALLPSPALPVSAPVEAPELPALPTPEPAAAPLEPSPDREWAAALRAFGRR